MDSILFHSTFIYPASKGINAVPVDVEGYAMVNKDSLSSMMESIRESMNHQQQAIDQLSTEIDEIAEYGIGFDDALGLVSIPFLIALFAFAFPFLYDAINNINNKYESRAISELFNAEMTYKRFMTATKWGAIYLIVIAFLALIVRCEWRYYLMSVVNGVGVIAAAYYAYATYKFVQTCVTYNDTQKLLQLLATKYMEDLADVKKKEQILDRKADEVKYKFWKSDKWKKYYREGIAFTKPYLKFNTDNRHIERLIDFSKYAIKQRDEVLFSHIMLVVDELTEIEKKSAGDKRAQSFKGMMEADPLRLTRTFYEAVQDHYLLFGNDKEIEKKLLNSMMRAFNRSLFPNGTDIVCLLRSIINAVECGNVGLLDRYVKESRYGYNFILRLPTVAFISGYDEEGQLAVCEQMNKEWNELKQIHFLVAAYLFSKRHYDIIAPLLAQKGWDKGELFPVTGPAILKCYLQCKENQNEDGSYHYWMTEKLFDQSTDSDMLERYTAALMVIANSKAETAKTILPKEIIKELIKAKTKLADYATQNKDDAVLTMQYPKVLKSDFDQVFDESIRVLEHNITVVKGDKQGFMDNICELLESMFCNKQKKISTTIFEEHLNPQMVKTVAAMADSVLYRNIPLVEFNGSKPEGKQHEALVGIMAAYYDKGLFIDSQMKDVNWFIHFKHIFTERVTYMTFAILAEMKHDEVEKNAAEFEAFLMEYTNDKPEDFAIIDTNSGMRLMLDVSLRDNDMFGAAYYDFELLTSRYMRDFPLLRDIERKLIIIRKDDLPVLIPVDGFKGSTTEAKDTSDAKEGRATVLLSVDPHLKLVYDKSSNYMMVKHVPMNAKV